MRNYIPNTRAYLVHFQITNGIYALVLDPEYNICQGNASIRDVWDFPIEADPFIDKFEAGVCDFDGVLDELNNSSFFQKLDNIVSSKP